MKPGTNFNSRISQKDFDVALNKLCYELKYRKEEYINLCHLKDPQYTAKIDTTDFTNILNKFTVYLNDYEKKLIIYKTAINDKYIDYLSFLEMKKAKIAPFEDIFLSHLNDERFRNYNKHKKNIENSSQNYNENNSESSSNQSENFGLTPIDITNGELNEENFRIKISKKLMMYFLTHTGGERPKEFTQHLYNSSDFDSDGKYTIGELNNFLINCDETLGDSDLRFLFEYFPIINGRLDIEQLNQFIEQNSERNFEKPTETTKSEGNNRINFDYITKNIDSKLESQINYQKEQEEQRMKDATAQNYIIVTIKDCLLIFGKEYLLNYFRKYLFEFNDSYYINDNNFLLGINSLGYKPPSGQDVNNFKYICVQRNLGEIKGFSTNIAIDILKMFNFIINFFNISETIKIRTPEELINAMGQTYINKINESFLKLVSDSSDSEIKGEKTFGERIFRKKFIQNFGFIDHSFFNIQVQKFCVESEKEEKDFNFNVINAKKFIEFSYNFVFLNLIKNYKELGLLIDKTEHELLNRLYSKIKYKIFSFTEEDNQNIAERIYTNLFTETSDSKNRSKQNITEDRIFGIKYPDNQEILNRTETLKNENFQSFNSLNEYFLYKKIPTSTTINGEIKNSVKNQPMKQIPPQVNPKPVESIPELYNTCVKYIIQQFHLDKVDYNLLKGIGICKIFRDHLKKLQSGLKQKMHWFFLIQNLEQFVSEVVKQFLTQIALNYKDTDGNINVQFYFSKLEEILLLYYCSLSEEKSFSKYYV